MKVNPDPHTTIAPSYKTDADRIIQQNMIEGRRRNLYVTAAWEQLSNSIALALYCAYERGIQDGKQ